MAIGQSDRSRGADVGRTVSSVSKRIHSIQYLRYVAAILVVCYHAFLPLRAYSGQTFYVGAAGVDIFFVISGFVMWTIRLDGADRPGRFLLQRLIRIAPLYWMVTAVYIAVWLGLPRFAPDDYKPGQIAASFLFIPYLDGIGRFEPIVSPGWSLNIEMLFYLLIAATLMMRRRTGACLIVVILLLCATIGLTVGHPPYTRLGFYINPIVLEFAFGMAIAELDRSGALPKAGGTAVALLGVIGLLGMGWSGWNPEEWRIIFFGIPAGMIVLGLLMIERAGRLVQVPLLEALGDASYSLYLIHTMMIAVLVKLFALRSIWVVPIASVTATLLSVVIYRYVETPVTAALRRAISKAPLQRAPAPSRGDREIEREEVL